MEFRLAQSQPGQNLLPLPIGKYVLYYFPPPVLTGADLALAESMKTSEGQAYVHIEFNRQGTQRLAQLTQFNGGRWLLITVDGKLVAEPRIGAPISDGIINMTTGTDIEAARIVNGLIGAIGHEGNPK
ncbi:hypothetical protein ACFOY1_21010 [Candidimonas humi]|uniref:SecDF P1 head subdomain domain-containing protein n=1 Tax=Candidimonas humi TaxID=683355 RepID=A0ABV8P5N1_9BURK